MEIKINRIIIIVALLTFLQLSLLAQGIKGIVRSNDGTALPFASVFISPLKTGTTANSEGYFELKLPAGMYTIRVQNIGYKAEEAQVEVKDDWVTKEFTLSAQGYILDEVQVGKGRKEDFAYTIIRKAIAKKKFHLLQCNSYEMKVYIKGTGELTKAPFFLKNKLKKEGVNLNEAYTTESVSRIKFTQPNKIDEKVIAIRTKGSDNSSVSPAMFINQSFYRDKIAGLISPLSRSAFTWYKFTYEGSFSEGKYEINKIRVTPRSRGDNVFEGTIYIIEDEWAIHSLDLRTSIMGFPVSLRQNYVEVAPKVWMPVTHRYQFSGNVLGFKGHYNYLASCRDYKVELNKDLLIKAEIVDEKIDPAPEEITALKQSKGAAPVKVIPESGKLSRKQFNKMMDEYEKKALKEQKHPEVIADRNFGTDSSATKRDSSFWSEIRSIPLTSKEQEGYRRDDSLAKIESARLSGKDSLKVIKKRRFNPGDIITGGAYNISAGTSISINPTFTQVYYNTVEGFNINLSGRIRHQYDSLRRQIEFSPAIRYGFSSGDIYAKARLAKTIRNGDKRLSFSLEGGNFVEQFNPEAPIHPIINTFSSLFYRRNYMKIYEKAYGKGALEYSPSAFLKFSGGLEWTRRRELFNQSDYSFFYQESREYSSNRPVNIEIADTRFPNHEAFIFEAAVSYRPIKSYRMYNGSRIALTNRSPEFLLNYTKGIKGPGGSDVDFDKIELGMNHGLRIGAAGKLEFELSGGGFLNSKSTYFMDYIHFDGNRTILSSLRPAGSFRLLDYYTYSTGEKYFSAHTHYQFRKLLLTRIPEVRYTGIKENVFFNYLKTSNSPHYYEAGYSLDNVFRIFRIEAAVSFLDQRFHETGIRVGIATVFRISGGD
ncbi:carboxypeptidase-like protein [Arcticibacter tournemirensis]|uniref:Carboxypeptidase-like regulatory domain-containing protein n=1 Tax=Arcticibacter tournemirensis TaxID=699437 RepID=A0A5M9HI24_9SPHI|nr:DUF5686 and carboxypeptidase regulatory-like domain-containing protein [Arcticibacter tournemirensis]KAA8485028.1 carboxypeptidase-like regulatory domain-containing protein [Arcticibacter tournemirensis]TQM50517.1 carboxypeptidase-like protein [Arcticibacter tournemirensis]